MVKRIVVLAVMLLLSVCLAVTAFAHPVPDLSTNGSITFAMYLDEKPLDGGKLNLYKVGDIYEDDGNYSFALMPEYTTESELPLDYVGDENLAMELLTLAKEEKLTARTASIEDGEVVFHDLEHGLYVVWQDKADATKGFAAINPFLISVPKFEEGVYVLDIVATPKVGLETIPPTTKPPAEDAPQTGQLYWPVPVMAISGAILFILGFVLWTGRKRAAYER